MCESMRETFEGLSIFEGKAVVKAFVIFPTCGFTRRKAYGIFQLRLYVIC